MCWKQTKERTGKQCKRSTDTYMQNDIAQICLLRNCGNRKLAVIHAKDDVNLCKAAGSGDNLNKYPWELI